jgi:hypothetical protein
MLELFQFELVIIFVTLIFYFLYLRLLGSKAELVTSLKKLESVIRKALLMIFKYSESLASEDELNDMEWCCIQNF